MLEFLFIYLGLNMLTILIYKLIGEYDDVIDYVVDELSKIHSDVNRNIIALIVIILTYLLAFPDLVYGILIKYILKR